MTLVQCRPLLNSPPWNLIDFCQPQPTELKLASCEIRALVVDAFRSGGWLRDAKIVTLLDSRAHERNSNMLWEIKSDPSYLANAIWRTLPGRGVFDRLPLGPREVGSGSPSAMVILGRAYNAPDKWNAVGRMVAQRKWTQGGIHADHHWTK